MSLLRAQFRQDQAEGAWTAETRNFPVIVQGETLEKAHARLVEALQVLGASRNLRLRSRTVWERNDLAPDVLDRLKKADNLRLRMLDLRIGLDRATKAAVDTLADHAFTYRAAGKLLGISHSRVEQIEKSDAA